MLALLGALDNISVVIRHTLELTYTPDEMRGRVGSVHTMFIGASNELGGFESGVAAALLGPVGAVVVGGFGTLLVVLGISRFSPELRELKRIGDDPRLITPTEQPVERTPPLPTGDAPVNAAGD